MALARGAAAQDRIEISRLVGPVESAARIGIHGIRPSVGRAQQAPLTPEYQAIYEADLADQAAGGQGIDPTVHLPPARHAAA